MATGEADQGAVLTSCFETFEASCCSASETLVMVADNVFAAYLQGT